MVLHASTKSLSQVLQANDLDLLVAAVYSFGTEHQRHSSRTEKQFGIMDEAFVFMAKDYDFSI